VSTLLRDRACTAAMLATASVTTATTTLDAVGTMVTVVDRVERLSNTLFVTTVPAWTALLLLRVMIVSTLLRDRASTAAMLAMVSVTTATTTLDAVGTMVIVVDQVGRLSSTITVTTVRVWTALRRQQATTVWMTRLDRASIQAMSVMVIVTTATTTLVVVGTTATVVDQAAKPSSTTIAVTASVWTAHMAVLAMTALTTQLAPARSRTMLAMVTVMIATTMQDVVGMVATAVVTAAKTSSSATVTTANVWIVRTEAATAATVA